MKLSLDDISELDESDEELRRWVFDKDLVVGEDKLSGNGNKGASSGNGGDEISPGIWDMMNKEFGQVRGSTDAQPEANGEGGRIASSR